MLICYLNENIWYCLYDEIKRMLNYNKNGKFFYEERLTLRTPFKRGIAASKLIKFRSLIFSFKTN
jgi:hypothetical protein